MKKILITFSTIFLFYSCSKNQYRNNFKSKGNSTIEKTIDFLEISKDSSDEGYISIKYKFSKVNTEKSVIKLRYFDYDDNIFPLNGVGIINDTVFKLEKFTIINDSILFLPLIANNKSLSINILNLKTKDIIVTDIRTFLSFVWINTLDKKLRFIISDSPKIISIDENKEMFQYRLKIYEIQNGELKFVKKEILELSDEINDNIKLEFKRIFEVFKK